MKRFLRKTGEEILLEKPTKPTTEKYFVGGKGIAFHVEELGEYMKQFPAFKGALYLSELPKFKFPQEKLWGIIILLPPPTPSGKDIGHFVAMVFDTQFYHEIDFFDSFGRTPEELNVSEEITHFIQRFLKEKNPILQLKLKINTLKKQKNEENRCGTFVVQFLIDRIVNRKNFKQSTGFKREKMLKQEKEIVEEIKFDSV